MTTDLTTEIDLSVVPETTAVPVSIETGVASIVYRRLGSSIPAGGPGC